MAGANVRLGSNHQLDYPSYRWMQVLKADSSIVRSRYGIGSCLPSCFTSPRGLAHVDIFRYSNVYESTPLGKELLKTKEGDNLLAEAYIYAVKSKNLQKAHKIRGGRMSGDLSPSVMSSSPFTLTASGRIQPQMNSMNSLDLSGHGGSNSLGWTSAVAGWAKRMEETSSSFPSRTGHLTIAEEEDSGDERAPPEQLSTSAGAVGATTKRSNDTALKEIEPMKNALAQIYASCDRSR